MIKMDISDQGRFDPGLYVTEGFNGVLIRDGQTNNLTARFDELVYLFDA